MFNRSNYIALILVAVLTLILLNLPAHTAARLKLAFGSLFVPLFGLARSTQQAAESAGNALTPRGTLLQENQTLRRENRELRLQLMQAAAAVREDARLRQYYGWQQKAPWKLKLARVVLRDPANWWRTVQIDLGSRDGLQANLPVLTPDGLVGRTAAVSLTRSEVVLVGDPACRVAARVQDAAGDTGILESAGPLDGSLLTLDYLPGDAKLAPGQEVVTSGLGGIYPPGIPIGKIVDARQVEYGLYTQARVRLNVNLGGLEDVWVLMR